MSIKYIIFTVCLVWFVGCKTPQTTSTPITVPGSNNTVPVTIHGLDAGMQNVFTGWAATAATTAARLMCSLAGFALLLLLLPAPLPSTSIYSVMGYAVAVLLMVGPWVTLFFG